ncbi:MAG: arginase [Planctomycetota bacterium]|nr:MAG: arginase [Planctomycetota bacterium]
MPPVRPESVLSSLRVSVLSVPMDLGASRRGTDMGPSALRYSGLSDGLRALGLEVTREQDIHVPSMETRLMKEERARFKDEIRYVCTRLAARVEAVLEQGAKPLVLGGDHSIAMGTVAGVAGYFRKRRKKIGLLWFDAHADMNIPETSPTGNIHGMPLSHLLGYGDPVLAGIGGFSPKVRAENVVLVGIREVDVLEREVVRKSGVRVFTMREIDERGMAEVAAEAVRILTRGTAGFHVSFDVDGLDPSVAPGTATPVAGGVEYREAHLLLEHLADTGRMTSMEVVELNPITDISNISAERVRQLILSAFGKSIL